MQNIVVASLEANHHPTMVLLTLHEHCRSYALPSIIGYHLLIH